MLRSYVCPNAEPKRDGVPVRMRVGSGDEYEIGTITEPDALPDFLRAIADFFDRQASQD